MYKFTAGVDICGYKFPEVVQNSRRDIINFGILISCRGIFLHGGIHFLKWYIFSGGVHILRMHISWRGTYFKGTKFLKWYNFSLISQGTYFGVYILSLGLTHLGRLSLGPTHLGRLWAHSF